MSNYKIERIYTDNPLLDELVYACKIMMTDCILKDQEEADSYETLETVRNSDIYAAIVENRARFEYFDYSYELLVEANVPVNIIPDCIANKQKIPQTYRNTLIELASKEFIDEYVEDNLYYRTLYGQPEDDSQIIYLKESDIENVLIDINISKPIHKLSNNELLALESAGVLDELEERYPTFKYIHFLGKRKITPYNARNIDKFGILYVQQPDDNLLLKNRFCELLTVNKNYTMKTIYNEAYKFNSDNYDKFMIVFIIIQSVIDMLIELPEYYIRRDIFDIRTIQYFFESAGLDYFSEIPLKYQISLVQNLNKLIKYSATNKVIVEIASLFGFDNIEIFAYYMLKERKTDSEGNYLFETKEDPINGSIVPDNNKNYELKFIKVPLNESIDNYIKDKNNHYDYNYLANTDKYWNGEYTKDEIKEQILQYEFNIIRTKYISVDAVVELTDLSFQIPYFTNMIMFSNIENDLKVPISVISNESILLTDLFILIYSLMYEYYGLEDTIIDTSDKYLAIKGFNFDVNMAELSDYVTEKGFTLEELGVSEFTIPKGGILTFNQLIKIYTKNKEIHDHLLEQMMYAESKKIYDIYKYLYDALMFTETSYKYYYIEELNRSANTYSEYLQYKNHTLYTYLFDIKSENDATTKELKITNAISTVTTVIHDYLNSAELSNIFANIPTLSTDYIKNYMFKVINFFKSYKIDLTSVSNIYKFDNKYENKVFVLDRIAKGHFYRWKQILPVEDRLAIISSRDLEDKFIIEELTEIFNYLEKQSIEIDQYEIKDKLHRNLSLNNRDKVSILADIDRNINRSITDYMNSIDKIGLFISSRSLKDNVNIQDDVYIEHYKD